MSSVLHIHFLICLPIFNVEHMRLMSKKVYFTSASADSQLAHLEGFKGHAADSSRGSRGDLQGVGALFPGAGGRLVGHSHSDQRRPERWRRTLRATCPSASRVFPSGGPFQTTGAALSRTSFPLGEEKEKKGGGPSSWLILRIYAVRLSHQDLIRKFELGLNRTVEADHIASLASRY